LRTLQKKPTSHPTTRLQGRSQLEKYHEKTSQPQGRGFLDNADFNKFCFLGVFKDPLSSRGRLVWFSFQVPRPEHNLRAKSHFYFSHVKITRKGIELSRGRLKLQSQGRGCETKWQAKKITFSFKNLFICVEIPPMSNTSRHYFNPKNSQNSQNVRKMSRTPSTPIPKSRTPPNPRQGLQTQAKICGYPSHPNEDLKRKWPDERYNFNPNRKIVFLRYFSVRLELSVDPSGKVCEKAAIRSKF